jgi:hypothetical protein
MVKGGRFICEDENPFTITISKTPVLSQPFNIAICGSYTSILVEGNYFGGVEQNICWRSSSKIKLYTYMQRLITNCFDEKKFNIISIII